MLKARKNRSSSHQKSGSLMEQVQLIGFRNNPKYSDIRFIVRPEEDRVKQVTFHCHKILFAAKSPVFDAMFSSSITIQNNEIRIIDVEPNTFSFFMSCIYQQDQTEEDVENEATFAEMIKLAYVATKYMVEDLLQILLKKIMRSMRLDGISKLTAKNAFKVQKMVLEYIPDSVAAKFVDDFIDRNAAEIIKTEEFLYLENASLTKFLASDSLLVRREMDLFKALWAWATRRCLEKHLPIRPKLLRQIMGPALYQIRFPTMDFYTFSTDICLQTLLTDKEITKIVRFMNLLCAHPNPRFRPDHICHPFNVERRHYTLDGLDRAKTELTNLTETKLLENL